MRRAYRGVSWLTTLFLVCSSALVMGHLTPTAAHAGTTGALQTTINTYVDGGNFCNNGNPAAEGLVNCNSYTEKQYVWFNSGGLDAGTYFWAVLDPGAQAIPLDGAPGNLSSSVDAYTNRTFDVDGSGGITYAGSHDKDLVHNALRVGLTPSYFDDTANHGNVYVLAVCSLAGGYNSVTAASCKYDAFKVGSTGTGTNAASDLITLKTATGSFTRTLGWTIGKSGSGANAASGTTASPGYTVSVSHDSGTDGSYIVSGDIYVQNPNNGDASRVSVTDNPAVSNIAASSNCSFNNPVVVTDPTTNPETTATIGDPTNFSLPGGLLADLPYTCTFTSAASLTGATGVNTANVSWYPNFSDGSVSDASDNSSNPATANFGWTGTPTYTGTCTNVSDNFNGEGDTALGTDCYDPASGTDSATHVATGATFTAGDPDTFTYSRDVTAPTSTCGSYSNTASESMDGGTAGASVNVCGGSDLSVTTTADPTFTRTYGWSISKSVDKTLVEQRGGSATFNYTVRAWETGFTDSLWKVTGTITVTNPNDWEDITGVTVTDSVDNGGSCSVTNGTNVTVPRATVSGNVTTPGSVNLSYTCTYSSAPSANGGTNTATADWSADTTAATADTSKNGTKTFTFGDGSTGNPTEVNKTITVTDSFNNAATPATLGTLTATSSTPYASGTYTYAHTITVPSYNCLTYPNTASTGLTGAGQTARASVEVCGPVKTGALTMGFWQNKNGQGFISGAGVVSGTTTCKLTAFLRGYAPFQDLSSTAPCSGANSVATYVTNVIKAANASGTTMNAMLKGQMLATTLDVYFTTPGNTSTYGSFSTYDGGVMGSLGNATIDLSAICSMIDNSSAGSGSCGSTVDQAWVAFQTSPEAAAVVGTSQGGCALSYPFATAPTHYGMTVNCLLQVAASFSNAGGTNWYSVNGTQSKTLQGYAKDTFDAINNQVAFGNL